MLKNSNQKKIKIDGWSVYDLPIKYSEADYEEARAEVINRTKNSSGLAALFEWGCIPAPGISDMDFFAVFSDDAEKMQISSEPAFSRKAKYLMSHRILIISEKYYRKILYLDIWTTYAWPNGQRLLYQDKNIKRDLNFEKIGFSQEERNILSAAYISEVLEAVYANIPLYVKKEMPVRNLFETLKDCVYIIEEVNIVADKKIDDDNFSKEFKDLRNNWFEIKQEEGIRRMIELFHKGLMIAFEAAFSLGDWLDKNSDSVSIEELGIKKTGFQKCSRLDKIAKNVYLANFKTKRVFTDFVKEPKQALDLSVNSYNKIKARIGWRSKLVNFYIVFLPLGMANIPLGFVSENGILSNYLRKDIYTNQIEVPIFRPKVIQERIGIINEITEIYDKKRGVGSDGKGFIYGNNRFDYQFKKEKLRRKLLNFYLRCKFWKNIDKLI